MYRFAIAVAVGVVACNSKPQPESEAGENGEVPPTAAVDPDPTTKQAPPPEAAPVEVRIAARQPPEVTVLSPGRKPRQELTLRPQPGTSEGLEIVMKTSMAMAGSAGKIPPTGVPPIVMKGRARIETVNDSEIAFVHEVDEVTVRDDPKAPPDLVESLRAQLGDFEQYRAQMKVDPKGGLLGGTVDLPSSVVGGPAAQMMNRVTGSFGQVQVPLPREPVGVGARWRAEVVIDQAGLKLAQTVDYTLNEREEDVLFIEAAVRQKLVDRDLSLPGMGVDAKVTKFESTGNGSMQLDLGHLVPTHSEMETKIDMGLEMEVAGETQTQNMAMIIAVGFSRT